MCPGKSLLTGYPPELDDKTLPLKESCSLVIGHGEIKLVLTKSILPDSQLSEYQKVSWEMLGGNIDNELHNSGMNVMGVTTYFLIGFKAHSIRGHMSSTVNLARNLWLRSSQVTRITYYNYSLKLK